MHAFDDYIESVEESNQGKLREILTHIHEKYPQLSGEIKWNTPMFMHKGTYIIGISAAKHHLSISPESYTLERFLPQIKSANYTYTKGLFRIKWDQVLNYELLDEIIEFNIKDKADYPHFWRTNSE